MKFIGIKNTTKVCIIDDEESLKLSLFDWYLDISTNKIRAFVQGKIINIATFILGEPPDEFTEVDHIDRDIFNNQKSNLRFCTHQQNCINRNYKNTSSGYRGVYWDKKASKWMAQIRVKGKIHTLGRFITKEEAAKVYNDNAKLLHGEFAVLNIIEEKKVNG